MLLSCYVLGTGTIFSIPLSNKIVIKREEYSIESLTIDILKKYIWEREKENLKFTDNASKLDLWHVNIEEVVDIFNEDDIVQKLEGNKMKPNFLFNRYFIDKPPVGNIHIIIQQPATTDHRHTEVSLAIADHGYLPRQCGLGGTMLPSGLKMRSTNEGVNVTDPDISLRFDIILPLIRDLLNKKVILVQAPPFSGKTSLAQILEYNLVNAPEFSNHRIVRVSMIWGQTVGVENCFDSFRELWLKIIGIDWFEWLGQCRLIETILIIDEAQLIYGREKKVDEQNQRSADQFWMMIKSLLQEVTHINIIMFAAYGYRSSNTTGLTTPVTLPESNCKSLIDINFTCDELEKYIGMFCRKYFRNLDSSDISNLYKYIQVVTEGHAGLVRHILIFTEDAMKKRINSNRLIWEEIFKYLNSKEFDISIYNNCRAVPNVKSLNRKQLELCEETYLKGKTSFSDDEDAVYLVKTGVLMVVKDDRVSNSTDIIPTDLYQFIVKIFTAMYNEQSGNILRKTLRVGSEGRILEQTWQKEFYRIGTQVLGRDHFLSWEVGSVFGCEGKIDFYVEEFEWAIELLRDGEDMKKYKDRFESEEKYEKIVKIAKSIAIIDIRSIGRGDTCNEAKEVWEMKADFIYVSCFKNFDAFKIESLDKKTVSIGSQN
ncbi:hypothetical protein RhiirA1_495218 [Rhizophagus irregularis]|uniref:Crinkler effector protein N-terminal domain-containing protein n=1 Tax=Rhizophagus irregularis TaxID=588596 RepID=A0A2N0S8F9_9GLOM|nr:hypothetical protein RhiirA1_495218 [Rhizophagus irregularis]CAB4475965.1 unnamed protein product [Rhizophagus irregularis]